MTRMDVREKLVDIVKKAAYSSLPSNTEDFHLNMFVTNLEQVRAQRETEKKTRRSIDDFRTVRKVKQRRTMKEWERRQNGR